MMYVLEINPEFVSQYTSFYDTTEGITEFIVRVLERCGRYLNDIKVECYYESPLNYEQIMKNLQKYCLNIDSLHLEDNFGFKCKQFFTEQLVQLIFNNNKNLKEITLVALNLNGKCFSYIRNPEIIESLKLRCLEFEVKKPVLEFISNLKNLKRFHTENSGDFDELAIKALCESNCISIAEIFVREITASIIDDKLLEFFARQNKLQKIELDSEELDEKLINKIPESSFKEAINIYFPETVSDSFSRFRNLEKL